MAAVSRLVTFADVCDDVADARVMSVSVHQEAELADGRRVLLVAGRGWTSSLHSYWPDGALEDEACRQDDLDIWAATSVEDIEADARRVVGPDEPFDGSSHDEAETVHWAWLAGVLRKHGVIADTGELRRLPHDVVLGAGLRAHLGRDSGAAGAS